MAEVFGIAAGAIGIASAFTACIDCFDLVQAGRHLERDFEDLALTLECARSRLSSWGEAVNIYASPPFAGICSKDSTKDTVQKVFVRILAQFQLSQKISALYSEAEGPDDATPAPDAKSTSAGARSDRIVKRLKDITQRRRQGPSLIKRVTWAVYHQHELEKLITKILEFVNELEILIPASARRLENATRDVLELTKDATPDEIEMLQQAAAKTDKQLELALQSSNKNIYTNMNAVNGGRILNGVSIGRDWSGSRPADSSSNSSSNTFADMSATGLGSRIFNGTMYGGSRDFWGEG